MVDHMVDHLRGGLVVIMKMGFRFRKEGMMRFISHLDLLRTLIRAMRRAGMALYYSQGYHPRPRLSIASALALGMAGRDEYGEIQMKETIGATEFMQRLNGQLPEGLKITKAEPISGGQGSLCSRLTVASYLAFISPELCREDMEEKIACLMDREELLVKRGERMVNVRPSMERLEWRGGRKPVLHLRLKLDQGPVAKVAEILSSLSCNASEIVRISLVNPNIKMKNEAIL